MNRTGWKAPAPVAAALATVVLAIGCGDGSSAGSGGAGGGGGVGGSDGSSGASTTSSGTGGSGGSPVATCLDASAHAALFTIEDATFCAVALYQANESLGYQVPSWGSHGGPLVLVPNMDGSVDLVRWKAPAGATGELTKQETHVAAMLPQGSFASAQAIDLPFFGWTAFSWTGAFPDTQGEIVTTKGGAVDLRFPVNGAYAMAGLGDDAQGRVLYTGLSAIDDAVGNQNGLYAADTCGTTQKPDLLPGADPSCKPPIQVAAWGDASGPVAADRDGNAFVVLASFAGDQEARGFAAAEVARGAAPASGTSLFTIAGFGTSLAAITPAAGAAGKLVFQAYDPATFAPLDPIALAYTATSTVKAEGVPSTFLKRAAADMSLSFMTDAQDRLWVAVTTDKDTTFVVIAPKPQSP